MLERAAAGYRDGGGSSLVVAGEAGVGKSRLLAEASRQARRAGMLVLRGRAASGAGQAPFRAVAEALAGGLRERVVPETSLRNFAPALAHMLPGWFERTSDRAPDLVFLAEGVLLLLRLLAGARGVVLGLEDLQWADPESLALVEYLAENSGTERLVLVVTVRDDEPSAPLVSLRELVARGGVRWLELGRLAQDEVLRLAAARPGGAVPASVSQLLQVTAEGLPLFVEELLGGLIAAGALRRQGEEWQAADRVDLHLPSSFVASVKERVAALTNPTQSCSLQRRCWDAASTRHCFPRARAYKAVMCRPLCTHARTRAWWSRTASWGWTGSGFAMRWCATRCLSARRRPSGARSPARRGPR